ncbi:MAG TPA: universal stress protein, partial [Micromonosporaceae bacterium]
LANVPYQPQDWTPTPATAEVVGSVARRVAGDHPDLVIETAVVAGGGGPVLVEESATAALLVVGSRGAGGLAGRVSGSVGSHVAARAFCPVMVVRHGNLGRSIADGGRVCVGIDGTAGSLDPLRYACAWASGHATGVDVVHVVTPGKSGADLEGYLDQVRLEHPGLDLRVEVRHAARESDALVAATRTSVLLVVGPTGSGDRLGIALGPVAGALIRSAACPVVVTPSTPVGPGGPGARDLRPSSIAAVTRTM